MKRAAGVVLVVEINGVKHAVLSRRGLWNWEKMAPESWQNGYQVTAAGKLEERDGEDYKACALRELQEETGMRLLPPEIREVYRKTTPDQENVTFVSMLPPLPNALQKSPAAAHLLPVTLEQARVIGDMKTPRHDGNESSKDKPFAPEDGIRMFADEKEAVIKALAAY